MTSSAFSIGLSGMQAAQMRLNVSAHNIANQATAGFARQQAVTQSQPSGGVRSEVRSLSGPVEDLAADLVSQRQAQHLYTANLRTVQVADRLLGSLLDAVS